MKALTAAIALVIAAAGCSRGPLPPAPLDTRNDACAECRMTVSAARFASQIVAPGEEPRFFDDLGCLAAYMRHRPPLPSGAVVYVADHRTREWVVAATAVFTKVAGLDTPMDSQVVAHASVASRDADAAAAGGQPIDAGVYFSATLPGGRP